MSKIKMSFSLIIALFLVGILSTAAFAKDPYGLKPYQISGTTDLAIPFTYNSANGDTALTTYDLYVNDPTTGADFLNGAGKGITAPPSSSPVTVSGLTPGVVYNVKLFAAGADPTTATPLSTSTGVVIQPHNEAMLTTTTNKTITITNPDGTTTTKTITVDQNGNLMKNDNLTGYDNTRKNRSGQQVHGFYQNNTNSCASCHQTHTGSDSNTTKAQALLFKDGVYSTCSACHDGTTGAYNNFSPVSASNVNTIDGTFAIQSGHNGSIHEADGSLQVAAAPGGNKDAKSAEYGQQFDCASCHAPHGSGSNAENNLNIDPLGWGAVGYAALPSGVTLQTASSAQKDALNGKLINSITIVDLDNGGSIPTTQGMPYILVKSTVTAANLDSTNKAYNYFWARSGVTAGTRIIQTYRWTGDTKKYQPDYSLWLQELGYPAKANTKLMDSTGADITRASGLTVVWRDAFAYGSGVDNIASANVSLGIDVETTSSIASLYDSSATGTDSKGKSIAYIPDSGVEMSKYCASCHVDYLSATRTDNTGVYSQAHRHATLLDETTCIRCHYAHGSEAQIMKDANDNTYYDLTGTGTQTDGKTGLGWTGDQAISYLLDPNPSSALKRYTGMSVCYACHGKGEQFMGNPNSNTVTPAQAGSYTGQSLLNGNPGDAGSTGIIGGGRTAITTP